jgi:hypothetical protein
LFPLLLPCLCLLASLLSSLLLSPFAFRWDKGAKGQAKDNTPFCTGHLFYFCTYSIEKFALYLFSFFEN